MPRFRRSECGIVLCWCDVQIGWAYRYVLPGVSERVRSLFFAAHV